MRLWLDRTKQEMATFHLGPLVAEAALSLWTVLPYLVGLVAGGLVRAVVWWLAALRAGYKAGRGTP